MCARLRIEGLPYLYSFHIAHKYTYVSNNIFLHIFKHCMHFSHNSGSFLVILKAYKLMIQQKNIEENSIEITFLLFYFLKVNAKQLIKYIQSMAL